MDTRVPDGGKALRRTNYKEFGNRSLRSYQETHLGVTDVNDIPGRHFDNTLTLYIHSTALCAFATGILVLDVAKVRPRCCFQKTGTKE